MSAFTLDTSGHVLGLLEDRDGVGVQVFHYFEDLSPFVQGYVEAALSGYGPRLVFSSLEPETLTKAIEDCRRGAALYTKARRDDGRHFWRWRQSEGARHGFPPLVFRLSDDGKVSLRETK